MAESIPARVAGIAWRWDDAGVYDVIVCRMRTPTGVTAEWLRATEGPRGRMYTGGASPPPPRPNAGSPQIAP